MTIEERIGKTVGLVLTFGFTGAIAVVLVLGLSGCLGLSDFNRTLDAKDALILKQCADLDNPVNAARIDAAALLLSATNEIQETRERREAYCDLKRAMVEGLD